MRLFNIKHWSYSDKLRIFLNKSRKQITLNIIYYFSNFITSWDNNFLNNVDKLKTARFLTRGREGYFWMQHSSTNYLKFTIWFLTIILVKVWSYQQTLNSKHGSIDCNGSSKKYFLPLKIVFGSLSYTLLKICLSCRFVS